MTNLPNEFLRFPLAHRALHDVDNGRPENSRAAIKAAINSGYGIEIDVQLSRDSEAMVFHDYDLGRLTGARGPIQLRNMAELSEMTLIGGEEGVPALTEILELVAGRVPLLIELKDQDGAMGKNIGVLERRVAAALAAYSGPTALMSFNPNSVAILKELVPNVPRGITTSCYRSQEWRLLAPAIRERLRGIPDYDDVGASFISHEAADLSSDRVSELKSKGAAILCWTIRSKADEVQARQIADNVTFEGYLP